MIKTAKFSQVEKSLS